MQQQQGGFVRDELHPHQTGSAALHQITAAASRAHGGGFRDISREQRVDRVIKALRERLPSSVLRGKEELVRHGGLSLLSKLASAEHLFSKITRKRDDVPQVVALEEEPMEEDEQPPPGAAGGAELQDLGQVFEDQRDQNLFLQLRHRKASQRNAQSKRPLNVTVLSESSIFLSSADKLKESAVSTRGDTEIEDLYEKMAAANLATLSQEAAVRARAGQPMGAELQNRVKKLIRLTVSRKRARKVEGLDVQRRALLRDITVALAPHYPGDWFQLLQFWLILQYHSEIHGEASSFSYLQRAVLQEVELTVQEAWFPGEWLRQSWVDLIRSIPRPTVDMISHIQRVTEAAAGKGMTLLGAKLVINLFHQYNSIMASQVQQFAEKRLDQVLGLSPDQDMDETEKQFYVSLYFKLCEVHMDLIVKILFYFEKLPSECLDVVRSELAYFLIVPEGDKKKKALLTSRSPQTISLMGKVSALEGEALFKKSKMVFLLSERFANSEENVAPAFSMAVLAMSRKLEMAQLAVPIFHCLEFDKASSGNLFERCMIAVIGHDAKQENVEKGVLFLQRLLTARTSPEERVAVFKSIVDLEKTELGRNTQLLLTILDSVVKPEFVKATYAGRALRELVGRRFDGIPQLTIYILEKLKEHFQNADDAIESVLRKLFEKKVYDHAHMWNNIKNLILEYPKSFVKNLRDVPHNVRLRFLDEHPKLKEIYNEKDRRSKPPPRK